MLSPGLSSAGPVGHSNHSPCFVVHLHSENLKFSLRTVCAPSSTGSTTGKPSPPTHPFALPSFAFIGGALGSLSFHLETRNLPLLGTRNLPLLLEGARGGMRISPSGSFCSTGCRGCSTTHSASWNSQILEHVGLAGVTPAKAGPDPGTPQPRGTIPGSPGAAQAQPEGAEVKTSLHQVHFPPGTVESQHPLG